MKFHTRPRKKKKLVVALSEVDGIFPIEELVFAAQQHWKLFSLDTVLL